MTYLSTILELESKGWQVFLKNIPHPEENYILDAELVHPRDRNWAAYFPLSQDDVNTYLSKGGKYT